MIMCNRQLSSSGWQPGCGRQRR